MNHHQKIDKIMDCKEFRNKIVEMFDKEPNNEIKEDLEQHMKNCDSCKTYYEDLRQVKELLTPKYMPKHSNRAVIKTGNFRRKLMRVAVAIVFFVLGLGIGLSHFFSTKAEAVPANNFSFSESLLSMKNVGNVSMEIYARTSPNENFSYLNPQMDFVKMSMCILHENDSVFWRVEKENGRTVVFDGKNQYMWSKNQKLMVKGPDGAGFLEKFKTYLHPEKLLQNEQKMMETMKDARKKVTETDSTLVVTVETEVPDDNVFLLLKNHKNQNYRVEIENIFDRDTKLLKSFCVREEYKGKKIVLVKSVKIKYNIGLNRKEVTVLPKVVQSEWIDAEGPQEKTVYSKKLRRETAKQAAERVLTALINNKTENAREALYYYQKVIPELVEIMKGCEVSDFSEPKRQKNYVGVYVFYKVKKTDGTCESRYLTLRNDNAHHLWIVDGGL